MLHTEYYNNNKEYSNKNTYFIKLQIINKTSNILFMNLIIIKYIYTYREQVQYIRLYYTKDAKYNEQKFKKIC